MQRSGAARESYRSASFTLQGIIQAVVFTYAAFRLFNYATPRYGTIETLPLSLGDVIVWNYVIALATLVATLAEYACYASVVARVPKVRDLLIMMLMGFIQTWLTISAETPRLFWLMTSLFFISVILIYLNTLTIPMLDPADDTAERKKEFRSHLINQILVTAAASIYSFLLFFALSITDSKDVVLGATIADWLLRITIIYFCVFGFAMWYSTGTFIARWFGD